MGSAAHRYFLQTCATRGWILERFQERGESCTRAVQRELLSLSHLDRLKTTGVISKRGGGFDSQMPVWDDEVLGFNRNSFSEEAGSCHSMDMFLVGQPGTFLNTTKR